MIDKDLVKGICDAALTIAEHTDRHVFDHIDKLILRYEYLEDLSELSQACKIYLFNKAQECQKG